MNNSWQTARDEGARLLDERDYDNALKRLEEAVVGDQGGESHALLGLAYFQRQEYSQAARHLESAVKRDPSNPQWRELRDVAQANATSEVNVHVPDLFYFDKDQLLAPAEISPGTLPTPPPPWVDYCSLRRRIRANVVGAMTQLPPSPSPGCRRDLSPLRDGSPNESLGPLGSFPQLPRCLRVG